jgi:hypothetical protein
MTSSCACEIVCLHCVLLLDRVIQAVECPAEPHVKACSELYFGIERDFIAPEGTVVKDLGVLCPDLNLWPVASLTPLLRLNTVHVHTHINNISLLLIDFVSNACVIRNYITGRCLAVLVMYVADLNNLSD